MSLRRFFHKLFRAESRKIIAEETSFDRNLPSSIMRCANHDHLDDKVSRVASVQHHVVPPSCASWNQRSSPLSEQKTCSRTVWLFVCRRLAPGLRNAISALSAVIRSLRIKRPELKTNHTGVKSACICVCMSCGLIN